MNQDKESEVLRSTGEVDQKIGFPHIIKRPKLVWFICAWFVFSGSLKLILFFFITWGNLSTEIGFIDSAPMVLSGFFEICGVINLFLLRAISAYFFLVGLLISFFAAIIQVIGNPDLIMLSGYEVGVIVGYLISIFSCVYLFYLKHRAIIF